MNMLSPFMVLDYSCDLALRRLHQKLPEMGLRLMQTFDLQDVRLGASDCPCPHHGTAECDCQMVILLVYGGATSPTTLILHGNDGETWLSLVTEESQTPDPLIRASIEKALDSILDKDQ